MYKSEFDKLQTLPNYFLFYGNSFYLNEYEKKIEEKFKSENILKLRFDDYDFEVAKNHLMQNSLFGGKSVLIVVTDKELKETKELINLAKDNYFFYFYHSNKPIKAFGKNSVRFFEPTLRDLVLQIEEYEKEFNVEISKEARLELARSVEPLFLKKEVEKLSLYKSHIFLDDVKKLVFEYKEESFEELFVSIIKGEDFFERLDLILQKQDFRRVLSAFIRYIRDLYSYYLYIKTTGNSSLEEFLGYKLPRDIESNRISLAIKLKEKDYFELLRFLLKKELEIRNSREEAFFEAMVFLRLFFTS